MNDSPSVFAEERIAEKPVNENTASRQVAPQHYRRSGYDKKPRFCSYWHQIDEVRRSGAHTVLEVGVGNGFTSRYLKELGLSVAKVDLDRRLKPDVAASVVCLPFADASFDLAVCYEVLEHLPFRHFQDALFELGRVSRGDVVISVPDASTAWRLYARLPANIKIRKLWSLARFRAAKLDPGGDHCWEIGVKGYPLSRIQQEIAKAGLKLLRTYRVFEYPRHRFFVMRKVIAGEKGGVS